MTLPIIRVCVLPSSSALTKSPMAGMNVRSEPAKTPGRESGRITRRNDSDRKNEPITRPANAPAITNGRTSYSNAAASTPASPPPTTTPAIEPPGRHGPANRSLAASTRRMSIFSRDT